MLNLATWMRAKDEKWFRPFFDKHPDIQVCDARKGAVALEEMDGLLLTGGSDISPELLQQEGEAVAKWKRARLTSAQLSTYFVGVSEHLDLRDKAKAKAGASFGLKKYNDQVISFGNPPVKYVRELMGL